MINGVGYVRTVEKMLGIEIPKRGVLVAHDPLRVLPHHGPLRVHRREPRRHRRADELLVPVPDRENIYGLLEACCGARLTVSYVRVGGLAIDVPDDFVARCRPLLESIPKFLDDVDRLVHEQPDRPQSAPGHRRRHGGAGDRLGLHGPVLRASGVPYDVRRAQPYDFYDNVRLGRARVDRMGDNFARYLVRMEEMRQSLKIIRQALDIFPASGPVNSDDWHVVLPPKDAVYHDMESLIYHFKLIMEGHPRARRASATSGSRGQRRARLLRDLGRAGAGPTA